jgi:hypothetical protein
LKGPGLFRFDYDLIGTGPFAEFQGIISRPGYFMLKNDFVCKESGNETNASLIAFFDPLPADC